MKHRYNRALCAAAAAAFTLAAASAAAAPQSVMVSYRDLDLTRPEGVAVLNDRLRAATRAVCGEPAREDPAVLRARRDCRSETFARAVIDAGLDPQLLTTGS